MTQLGGEVWITDFTNPESIYKKAEIIEEIDDKTVKVKILDNNGSTDDDNSIISIEIDKLNKANPSSFDGCNDMASLTYLNEPSVLNNLKLRYLNDQIYTHSGLFLVTVNPYKLIDIYNENYIKFYSNCLDIGGGDDSNDNSIIKSKPHIFGTAHQAFHNLINDKKDQSILVTGESGAGKTENTKKVIQYILSISTNPNNKDNARILENKILQANPILESFGNATTVKNLNSSRFGKFVKIKINDKNELNGAHIDWYLLEKSRVIYQDKNERNYHIFYQLLKGADEDLLNKLLLKNKSLNNYEYLKNGLTNTISTINDKLDFQNLIKAFKIINFSESEIFNIFKILSIILHLGNINFRNSNQDTKQAILNDDSDDLIDKISSLLGVKSQDFKKSFLYSKIKIGREIVNQQRTAIQAKFALDALSKSLYEKLFQYLVDKINENFNSNNSIDEFIDYNYIGILDIAGFEIFKKNSFEQLCINYTNEKLQQFFNHHMFVLEQKEYLKENISWKYIDFGNELKPTIELIEGSPIKKTNIFSILNEECVIPKGDDKSFINKLFQELEIRDNNVNNKIDKSNLPFKPNKIRDGFIIKHYAGSVDYSIDGWLDKNKDPLSSTMIELLSNSNDLFIGDFFQNSESFNLTDSPTKISPRKKSGMFRTVAQRHKEQLNSLMDQLSKTYPHFVRCILPNNDKKPSSFNDSIVLNQLRCNGVLEGIRIARSGYPNRIDFKTFATKYQILSNIGFNSDYKHSCEIILDQLNLDKDIYKVGLTKLFFRNGVLASIEKKKDEILSKLLINFNSIIRGKLFRKNFKIELQRLRASKILFSNFQKYSKSCNDPWFKLISSLKIRLDDSSIVELQYNNKISNLEHKIKNLVQTIDNGENNKKLIDSKVQLLENEISTNKSIIDKKNKEIIDSNNNIIKLEKELNDVNLKFDENKQLLDSKEIELDKLSKINVDNLEKLEIQNKELIESNNKLQKKYDSESKNLALLKNEITSLKSTIDKNEMELTSLRLDKKSKDNDTNKKLNDLKDKLSEAIKEKDTINSNLISKSTLLNSNIEKLSKLQKEYDSMLSEYQQLKEIKQEYESKKLALDQAERIKIKFKEQKRDLEQTKTLLKQKVNDEIEFNQGRQQYNKELQDIKDIVEGLKGEIEIEKRTILDLKVKLKHADLETENAINSKKLLQTENAQLKLSLRNVNPVQADMNQKLINQRNNSLGADYHKLNDNLRILQTRVSSEVEENRKLKALLKRNNIVYNPDVILGISTMNSDDIKIYNDHNEIDETKEELLIEREANKRLKDHNVQLQKDLMSYKTKNGSVRDSEIYDDGSDYLNNNDIYEYKSKFLMSELEVNNLKQQIKDLRLKMRKVSNPNILRSNSFIENSLNNENNDKMNNEDLKLKHENLRLSSKVNELKTKVNRFESGNSNRFDQEEEIIQLRHNLQTVQLKNSALDANIELYKNRSEDYYEKLSKMEVELSASTRERKKLIEDISNLKDKSKRLSLHNEEAEAEIQKLNNSIRNLEKQVSDKDLRIDELNSRCEALKDKFENSEELRKSVKSSHREFQESEIERLNKELTQSLTKETEINKLVRSMNLQLESSKKEISSAKSTNKELIKEKNLLNKSLKECISKNEGLLAEVKENIAKAQNLSQQVNVLKVGNSDLLKERDNLLSSKRLLEDKLHDITIQFDQHLIKVRDDANNAVIAQQLGDKLKESEQELDQIKKSLEEYQVKYEDILTELKDVKSNYFKTFEENKELAKFNKGLITKLKDNSAEFENKLKAQDKHWSDRVNVLESKIFELKTLHRTEDYKLESLNRTIDDLTIRNEDLKRDKKRSEEEIKRLEANIENLDQKYCSLNQREMEAQLKCKQLNGECDKYRDLYRSSQIYQAQII